MSLFLVGWGCSQKKTVASDQQAPDFQLTDLSGKKFALGEFKGKVVLLDFWATWCPPCVMASPYIEKIAEDYKNQPVEIIGLSLDQDEATVRQFASQHRLMNRSAMVGDSRVEQKYQVSGIPAFFLIDKKGKIVGAWVGFSPRLDQEWRSKIDSLLKLP